MSKNFILPLVFVACLILNSCVLPENVYEGDFRVEDRSDSEIISKYTSITGDLTIATGDIFLNEKILWMTNVNYLKNLTHVGGDLNIRFCHLLRSLDGLKNLESIGGTLEISESQLLKNLDGLKKLKTIGGDLEIGWADSLRNLRGLENIKEVGSIEIWKNPELSHFNLDKLNSVSGDFVVVSNESLPMSEVIAVKEQVLKGNGIGGEIRIKDNFDDSQPEQE